jgi:phenylacetate-coenzyme A ligase PaaK-like adenylate-forming protein
MWLNKFEQMKRMDYGQIRQAQLQALKDIVKLAYEQTVFYKRLYDMKGFHPDMLQDFSDVERIPIIHKEDVRMHGKDMVVSKYSPEKLKKLGTSGTTGTSLTLYSNRTVEQREWAAICFQWANVGYKPGDGRVEFRGALPGSKLYILDKYSRTLKINTTAITEHNIRNIVEAILASGYEYLYGFPSALAMFSKFLVDQKLTELYQPKAILLACEMVHDYQVHLIGSVFSRSMMFAHYGQTEKVALGGWMNESHAYYFLPLYSYVEQNRETSAIIGTSFLNDVMPLIRYELTDAASPFDQKAQQGLDYLFPVIRSIDGRMGEIMYKPNGDMLPSPLVAIALRGTRTFSACKLIQHRYDLIEIMVESSQPKEVVQEEIQMVVEKLKKLFTIDMNFKITIVPHITKTETGKFKNVEVRIGKEPVS